MVANQHVTAIEPADGVHCQPQRLEWRRPLGNEIAEEEDTVAAALGWAHGLEKQRQLLCAPVHITVTHTPAVGAPMFDTFMRLVWD